MNREQIRGAVAYVGTRTRYLATAHLAAVVRGWKWLRTADPVVQKTVYAVCGIAAAVVLLWLVLGPITDWATPVDGLKGKHLADVRTDTRQILLAAIGGIAVLVGLGFTGRTFYLSRRGQLTDRYSKAITQLASDKLTERLGGIYALEHLMLESDRDHETVIEVLAAFIRESTPLVTRSPVGPIGAEHVPPPAISSRPATDVQAALTVLGRRPQRTERNPIKLSHTNLAGAELTGANLHRADMWFANLRDAWLGDADLRGACLIGADLQDAWLYGADLQRATLTEADLQGAKLTQADLQDASLGDANLQSADLGQADLRGAQLWGAKLPNASLNLAELGGANLSRADLRHATLGDAKLQCADLRHADLRGAGLHRADLDTANLRDADLRDANLTDADLQGTYLWGADLGGAYVQAQQLVEAHINETTRLPAAVREALGALGKQRPGQSPAGDGDPS